jgi:hypothetical protein
MPVVTTPQIMRSLCPWRSLKIQAANIWAAHCPKPERISLSFWKPPSKPRSPSHLAQPHGKQREMLVLGGVAEGELMMIEGDRP